MKLSKYFLLTIITLGMVSCSEDFLNKAPEDSVNTENFYLTEADAIAAVMALTNHFSGLNCTICVCGLPTLWPATVL